MKNTIKTPTNYVLTIVNGPIRKQKKVIHFCTRKHTSLSDGNTRRLDTQKSTI